MKIYELKLSRKFRVVSSALMSIAGYLLLVMILNGIQGLLSTDGYNAVFGIAQIIIVTLYWILLNWALTKNTGGTKGMRAQYAYLFMTLIPIIIFTVITMLLVYAFPTTNFTASWNGLTFAGAPTLYWFLPYGYLYYMVGHFIPIGLFLAICIVYNFAVETIGIILGLTQRTRMEEHEQMIRRQKDRMRKKAQRPELVVEAAEPRRKAYNSAARRRDAVLADSAVRNIVDNDPFSGDSDATEQIIYTEALETISDDMIETHNKKQRTQQDTPAEDSENNDPPKFIDVRNKRSEKLTGDTPDWDIPTKKK